MSRRPRKFWIRLGVVATAAWLVIAGVYWVRELTFCNLENAFGCLFFVSPKSPAGLLYVIADWLGFGALGLAGNALAWIVLAPLLAWLIALSSLLAMQWVSAAARSEAVE